MTMTAYSRRGFRVRLILENYDDHRKKCFFFVNVLREKYVRNVIQRIWHFFYNKQCSTPDELFLEIDEFFIPPGESTLVLKENDVISVRVRPQPAGGAASSAAGAVRSTVAPLTATPGTLVESVALVLRRLQNGEGPDDSERSERDRLTKVAEMMAAESGSSDVSTDEEGVRDLASQLTSGREVVRLSQKMADQATPPPPCAAKKHDLDSEQLSLTEISRELRRRYEATRQSQPAAATTSAAAPITSISSAATAPFHTAPICTSTAASITSSTCTTTTGAVIAAIAAAVSPVPSMTSLDSPTSLIEMAMMLEASAETPGTSTETPGTSTETLGTSSETPETSGGVTTSTPFATPSLAPMRKTVGVSAVERPAHDRGGGTQMMVDGQSGIDGGAAVRQLKGVALSGEKVFRVASRGARSDEVSEPRGASRPRTVSGAPNVKIVYPEDFRKIAQNEAFKRGQPAGIKENSVPLRTAERVVQRAEGPAEPVIVTREAEQGSSKTASAPRKVIIVTKEDAKKWAQSKAAAEGAQPVEVLRHSVTVKASGEDLQRSAEERTPGIGKKTPIIVKTPITIKKGVTPSKSDEKMNSSMHDQDVNEVKRRDVAVTGLKRARSPSSESSSESDSSSDGDSLAKSTPAKKPATTTASVNDGASSEKKKKTRTRRRRGKKRRTPEALAAPPPPPPPQPRAADYAQRHGLPRGEIDRYKRAASVGIGWQTRPKNRRVVFDDDGNPVQAGAEPSSARAEAATGRGWRGAPVEGGSQWAWSQGRGEEQGTDSGRSWRGGCSRPDDRTTNASDQSGRTTNASDQSVSRLRTDHPGNTSTTVDGAGNVLATADLSRSRSSSEPRTGTLSSPKDSRATTQDNTAAVTNTSTSISNTSSVSTPSARPATGTTDTLSQTLDSARGTGDSRTTNSARKWSSSLGAGGSRRGGSLGAGLLPRAFMRPRRCVDPPRRSEVLNKLSSETTAATATVIEAAKSRTGRGMVSGTSDKLLLPDYLLASRAASVPSSVSSAASDAGRDAKRTEAVQNDHGIAEARRQGNRLDDGVDSSGVSRLSRSSGVQESSGKRTPCLAGSFNSTPTSANGICRIPSSAPAVSSAAASTSAPISTCAPAASSVSVSASFAVPSTASAANAGTPAPAPVSHTTVVLDGSGRPAEASVARDLRHLASSAERRPLVVVRRDRPLPGRAPYRETTKQEEPRSAAQSADMGASVGAEFGSVADTGASTDTACKSKTSKERHEGNADDTGGQGVDGVRGRGAYRGDFDTTAEDASEDAEDTDLAGSPSGDVYRNVSVILAGPPLETLSPRIDDPEESAEESDDYQILGDLMEESDDGEDSRDEIERMEDALFESSARPMSDDEKDSRDEVEWLEEAQESRNRPTGASVDSIANCNVVNAVGQNRRLEKQRARGLPPGGDKENQAPTDAVKDDKFYSQFPLMKEAARKGDLIAFKCWDMAADYTPYVSDYREATVMDAKQEKRGIWRLSLQLLEYRPRCRRRGRFEITTPDDDEIVDLEEESGIEERRWSELIQPRLLHP